MPYFVIFNKKGNIIYEEGVKPAFLNNFVSSLDPNVLAGSKVIRDEKVEYEIRGPLVYLCCGHKESIKQLIDKKKTKQEEKTTVKTVDEVDKLNYSQISEIKQKPQAQPCKKSLVRKFNFFSNKIHIDELKDKMEKQLVKKNVDYTIARTISECIINQCNEEKITYITADKFKKYVSEVLEKLIPSIDHKKFIQNIKQHSGIYSICFVGVNGVGKSTSLAKICYWLLANDLKVYIAACDTFRAGAVEQLKVHVERFRESGHNVGFYEKGYNKDDASVARAAIQISTNEKYDVILIDTAGRMHNKQSLMESLSKLIRVNAPNHIIYVGEALIGADSLDHIKEFNKYIELGNKNHKINSLILTKVDTVDDKVGQLLNMAFSSYSPILFLGTGQTNSDLTPVASDEIVSCLLS